MDKERLDGLLIDKMVLYASHMSTVNKFHDHKEETYPVYKTRAVSCAKPLVEQIKRLVYAQAKEEFDVRIDLLGAFTRTMQSELKREIDKNMKLKLALKNIQTIIGGYK